MASLRSKIIRAISSQYMRRNRKHFTSSIEQKSIDHIKARQDFEQRTTILGKAKDVDIREEIIDGIECEWHIPKESDRSSVIYYLHGGGFIVGSPKTHRRLVSFIAHEAGMPALVPNYRLAPENKYPAAQEDIIKVWTAIIRNGQDPNKAFIGGDSAGGNLSVSVILSLIESKQSLPVACFLMSPWVDLTGSGESYNNRSGIDPWFMPDQIRNVASKYCDPKQYKDALISPIYANLEGFPRTYIQVGDHEIMLSDSLLLSEKLRSYGCSVELNIYPEMWHVFQYFVGLMPESLEAIKSLAIFLRSELYR